jgi:hypothetical protein
MKERTCKVDGGKEMRAGDCYHGLLSWLPRAAALWPMPARWGRSTLWYAFFYFLLSRWVHTCWVDQIGHIHRSFSFGYMGNYARYTVIAVRFLLANHEFGKDLSPLCLRFVCSRLLYPLFCGFITTIHNCRPLLFFILLYIYFNMVLLVVCSWLLLPFFSGFISNYNHIYFVQWYLVDIHNYFKPKIKFRSH